MLAAGLKGIEKGYDLPDPIEEDIFEMSAKEREARGIKSLPESLGQAIHLTERNNVIREAHGDNIFDKFIENKKVEWDQCLMYVSNYELGKPGVALRDLPPCFVKKSDFIPPAPYLQIPVASEF